MKKGTIISRIVKEISLANYADDSSLTTKMDKTLKAAIPADVYGWFMSEVGDMPLTGSQGARLIQWIFKNVRKAEIDLNKIKLIRQARREMFIETIKEMMPTQATMVHVTNESLQAYAIDEEVSEHLIPYLVQILKRDNASVLVSIGWSVKEGKITNDDLQWMLRYCKPVSEYTQLLLI